MDSNGLERLLSGKERGNVCVCVRARVRGYVRKCVRVRVVRVYQQTSQERGPEDAGVPLFAGNRIDPEHKPTSTAHAHRHSPTPTPSHTHADTHTATRTPTHAYAHTSYRQTSTQRAHTHGHYLQRRRPLRCRPRRPLESGWRSPHASRARTAQSPLLPTSQPVRTCVRFRCLHPP